jgi:hypothetical protein
VASTGREKPHQTTDREQHWDGITAYEIHRRVARALRHLHGFLSDAVQVITEPHLERGFLLHTGGLIQSFATKVGLDRAGGQADWELSS